MTSSGHRTRLAASYFKTALNPQELMRKIREKPRSAARAASLPADEQSCAEGQRRRLEFLKLQTGFAPEYLCGKQSDDLEQFRGNIENMIGMTQVPTGVVGPIKVLGSAADGDYYVPLAATEGALVASYNRGACATYLCGGVTSICVTEGVQRSPVFKFKDLGDVGAFFNWILDQLEEFEKIVAAASRHAKLLDVSSNVEGNQIVLTFDFATGDASGQNMVTFCTDEVCSYILAQAPVKPLSWYIESNYSGDKKATAFAFSHVRGRKVTAEAVLSAEVVKQVLHTTPEALIDLWQTGTLAAIQSGAIGAQGHFANGLAALFIATGQDAACVAEAAVGISRVERTAEGSLYACVTLPNLIVGTIGGGTMLPTQRECLKLMDCLGPGQARKFAEICGALILGGELSISAAIASGEFTRAHRTLGRKHKAS
jgi:hydroxymethylglutaryl-CoA reductase (NADPH)